MNLFFFFEIDPHYHITPYKTANNPLTLQNNHKYMYSITKRFIKNINANAIKKCICELHKKSGFINSKMLGSSNKIIPIKKRNFCIN